MFRIHVGLRLSYNVKMPPKERINELTAAQAAITQCYESKFESGSKTKKNLHMDMFKKYKGEEGNDGNGIGRIGAFLPFMFRTDDSGNYLIRDVFSDYCMISL